MTPASVSTCVSGFRRLPRFAAAFAIISIAHLSGPLWGQEWLPYGGNLYAPRATPSTKISNPEWLASGANLYATPSSKIGIGTLPSTKLHVVDSNTEITSQMGLLMNLESTPTASHANFMIGGKSQAVHFANNMTGVWGSGGLVGFMGLAIHSGTGTVSNAYGIVADAQNLAAGSITNSYTMYIPNPYVPGGSITNAYGLYINNFTAGATANYPLYVAGGKSYFGGNVGIGTLNPGYALSVNGTIQTKEVIVSPCCYADYVFKPDHRLRPLTEVAVYIRQNHHLPDIPSEKEVQEKGIGLGEMQVKLLAKVEELTLHMIQADEKNTRLEQQNRELQSRIARLEQGGVKDAAK